jgi:DNA-binding transcriptional LysR family regulator
VVKAGKGSQGGRASGGGRRPAGARGAAKSAPGKKRGASPSKKKVVFDAPAAAPEQPRTFRLGVIPGATPGRWIDTWKQRMPHVSLELVPVSVATQRQEIGALDAALVRLPLDDENLHVIRLYEEAPVVVAPVDSHLLVADELEARDLEGEVLLTSDEDVLAFDAPGAVASSHGAVPTTADLIATVATGVGIAVIPMSLARLHHRKDVDYRVLRDGPGSTVAFVWPQARTTDDVETFVGIIRGRTANSSR